MWWKSGRAFGKRLALVRGRAGVVAGEHRADRRDDGGLRRVDAKLPVVPQARGREVLRADEYLLVRPARVGDDRLRVDVERLAAVGVGADVRAGLDEPPECPVPGALR